MKSKILRVLALVVVLGASCGLSADENNVNIWIDCESDMSNNAMFMTYLGTEEFCYRVKVRCDAGLYGGFFVDVYLGDGGVGFEGHVNDGFPPWEEGAFCNFGFAHLRNSGFTHACDFDVGKAELDVKAVHGRKCAGN